MGTLFSAPRAEFSSLYQGTKKPEQFNHLTPENKMKFFHSLSLSPAISSMERFPPDLEEFRLDAGSGPARDSIDSSMHEGKVVVMVDPLSTGFCISQRLETYGVKQILVWSDFCPEEIRHLIPPGEKPIAYMATVDSNGRPKEEVLEEIKGISGKIDAVYIGCETGVNLGEELAQLLSLPTNDMSKAYIRRNKFHQQEAAKNAGLNSAGQKLAQSMDDCEEFLKDLKADPFAAIVKPTEGAGSVGVVKCNSPDEVREAVRETLGAINVFGATNEGALIQEFLVGNEYVVDSVTLDGKHKIISMFAYDKRGGDSGFAYWATRLMHPSEDRVKELRDYALGVLDAVGIQNGCCHMEMIFTPRGPVLVETNCRAHGGEGAICWVAEMCIGHSQMTVYADSFLDRKIFDKLPVMYETQRYGSTLHLRAPASGVVKSINKEVHDKIKSMQSYRGEMLFKGEGDDIKQTLDAVTCPGLIFLVNQNQMQLMADYDAINELNDDLFVIEEKKVEHTEG